MKPTLRIVMVVVICSVWLSACDIISQAASRAPGTTNSVLFQDDFSDPGSGWRVLQNGQKLVNYDQGAFLIRVAEAGFSYWSTPRLKLKDVRIDVDVEKRGGPDNNTYGILCRYQDEDNFYSLVISSDGYYGIAKMKAGQQSLLGAEGMQVGEAIQQGAALNHLRADCSGNQLKLWVNGNALISVEDTDFTQGDVGVIASSTTEPGVEISFDNFIVQKP